ncbi:RNA polymerase sigma factor [Krasilnikoviella flava]|uniref:RNA polymerase sigma-70 factor, ECF subfamily n=1 Tax=Krasilnikoviella flava TaxID=526729 RepID=A0A1T5LJV9_9MICO|nr:RNA polymerase sigma factor [Krasilnikoviella flava]SKC75728.1 RNA polymerase sigma-70 factor, ECF subfamily [Krasilnikoviella flava]
MSRIGGGADGPLGAELDAALRSGDPHACRRAVAEAVATAGPDDVLDVLGRHAAAGSVLGTELLVELLDESGVVRRFVRGALLDESAVDDVCQDVLISVAGSLGSFAGASKVTTWVHGIVRHRVVDHLRRQRATAPLPDDDVAPGARMSSLIATRATVRDALAALPDLYREPVTLRDIEGLPYAEVADRLGRSLGTVKSQVSRGRALVAAALGGAL